VSDPLDRSQSICRQLLERIQPLKILNTHPSRYLMSGTFPGGSLWPSIPTRRMHSMSERRPFSPCGIRPRAGSTSTARLVPSSWSGRPIDRSTQSSPPTCEGLGSPASWTPPAGRRGLFPASFQLSGDDSLAPSPGDSRDPNWKGARNVPGPGVRHEKRARRGLPPARHGSWKNILECLPPRARSPESWSAPVPLVAQHFVNFW